mmetsp:Transcript_24991/g.55452  ORF Transcript_24991/g.55452 Transcript_24991/m.55452 type:complete len:349 (+) Transcript_24991:55-1101(+)
MQAVLFFLASILSSALSFHSHARMRPQNALRMAAGQVPYVPYYPSKTSKDYQWMDIYNALGRERTIFVSRYLDAEAANQLIASMIWLQGQNEKEPITLYFNVPGAQTKPSLAVYDVMQRMTCPIITINAGLTVGFGALLCAMGTPGRRFAFPNSRFLMGKGGLEGGIGGQASDVRLQVMDVLKDNEKLVSALARLCSQPIEKIQFDMKRDYYLTSAEAAAYGVVDMVLTPPQPIKMMCYRGSDDDVVGFGHFAEARKVKTGPRDIIPVKSPLDSDQFDDFAAAEMSKKGFNGRPNPAALKNGGGVNRFANSRCKPPGAGKAFVPKTPKPPGGDVTDEFDENPFKNTGW